MAVEVLHDEAADDEPESNSLSVDFLFLVLHAAEQLEQLPLILVSNADAGVLDGNLNFLLALEQLCNNLYRATLIRKVGRIRDNIDYDLKEAFQIRAYPVVQLVLVVGSLVRHLPI